MRRNVRIRHVFVVSVTVGFARVSGTAISGRNTARTTDARCAERHGASECSPEEPACPYVAAAGSYVRPPRSGWTRVRLVAGRCRVLLWGFVARIGGPR